MTMYSMMTHHDILPLPLLIVALGDNDSVQGEVPCESIWVSIALYSSARDTIKGSLQTMEYPATL